MQLLATLSGQGGEVTQVKGGREEEKEGWKEGEGRERGGRGVKGYLALLEWELTGSP